MARPFMQMYYRGKMFGFVHLYSGQEAVSTGGRFILAPAGCVGAGARIWQPCHPTASHGRAAWTVPFICSRGSTGQRSSPVLLWGSAGLATHAPCRIRQSACLGCCTGCFFVFKIFKLAGWFVLLLYCRGLLLARLACCLTGSQGLTAALTAVVGAARCRHDQGLPAQGRLHLLHLPRPRARPLQGRVCPQGQ